jgi:hypothetical protein
MSTKVSLTKELRISIAVISSLLMIGNLGDTEPIENYLDGFALYMQRSSTYAEVIDAETVKISLGKSVPEGRSIDSWVQRHHAGKSQGISFTIGKSDLPKITERAAAFLEIVRPGVRYPVAAYKYVCPRVAGALNRLHKVLDGHWKAAARGQS